MDQYLRRVRWAELRVGIIVSAALIILFFAVLFAGKITGLFERHVTVAAMFTDVRGLQTNAPVRFSGLDVGKVQSLTLKGPAKVEVAMSVHRYVLRYLKSDSTAVVESLDLFGDMYIELSAGSPEAGPLRPGGIIKGTAQVGFREIAQTARENLAGFAELTERLDRFVLTLEKGEGTLPRLIRDRTLYDNMTETTERLKAIVDRVEQGKGTLGLLVADDALYRNLWSLTQELERYAKTLRDSQGTLNKLVTDPSLYLAFTDAAQKLNAVLDRLEKGQGTLGNLLQNDEAWTELTKALHDLTLLLEDVRKNPKKYFKFSVF